MNAQLLWSLLKDTYSEWKSDDVPRFAAALSYYTAIAIAPLLVLLVTVIGWFYGTESAQVQLVGQLQGTIGPQAAEVVKSVVESADQPNLATFAGVISFLTLLWGASNLFVQLQDALNTIWGVQLKRNSGFMATIRERYLSFGMLLMICFALLVSLILSTVFSALAASWRDMLPGADIIWQIVDFVISFGVITLLFALIYKVLPAAKIAWSDVWWGAVATALLFTIGKWLLGIYLGYSSSSSAYGAAGSLLVFLIWVYYSAQICLFGAEFTQVYATRQGHGVEPSDGAEPRDDTATPKPVTQGGKGEQVPQGAGLVASRTLQQRTLAQRELEGHSFSQLVGGLLNDWYTLVHQEIRLVLVELQENLQKAARGAAFMAGGGLALNASVPLLLMAVVGIIYTVTMMPFWLAMFLVGLLALVEGGLLVISARNALKRLNPMPTQTINMAREDVQVVKEHLTS